MPITTTVDVRLRTLDFTASIWHDNTKTSTLVDRRLGLNFASDEAEGRKVGFYAFESVLMQDAHSRFVTTRLPCTTFTF